MTYIPPIINAARFTCPHCGAIAHQQWHRQMLDTRGATAGDENKNRLRVAQCGHCSECSVWVDGARVFPSTGNSPPPNDQMPEPVKRCYTEASEVVPRSPRAAAALLRLGIQLLCAELGENGKNINDDIASLVKKGLPEIVQQSLDVVRVTGNDAVHPGTIDTDDPEIVATLFDLTNIIVEYMIALPNRVSGLYSALPATSLSSIQRRDSQP
jgi:hypothetical protein